MKETENNMLLLQKENKQSCWKCTQIIVDIQSVYAVIFFLTHCDWDVPIQILPKVYLEHRTSHHGKLSVHSKQQIQKQRVLWSLHSDNKKKSADSRDMIIWVKMWKNANNLFFYNCLPNILCTSQYTWMVKVNQKQNIPHGKKNTTKTTTITAAAKKNKMYEWRCKQ